MIKLKYCPNCDNLLFPKNKKLYCKVCDKEFVLKIDDYSDYIALRELKPKTEWLEPIILDNIKQF